MVDTMVDWLLSSTEAHLGTATLHIHVEVGVVTVSYKNGRELTQNKGNTGNPKSYKPQEKNNCNWLTDVNIFYHQKLNLILKMYGLHTNKHSSVALSPYHTLFHFSFSLLN